MRRKLGAVEARVLEEVVAAHIRSGRPVGSLMLARRSSIRLSPASVRNVMAELERLGLLAKPHVSAGRVPTEAGYRFYVDRHAGPGVPARSDLRVIRGAIDGALAVSGVLERVSRALGDLTGLAGVAVSPRSAGGTVTRFEALRASSDTLLVTLEMEPGVVRTLVARPGANSPDRICGLVGELARNVVGRDLGQALEQVGESKVGRARDRKLAETLRRSLVRLARGDDYSTFVCGAGNILAGIEDRRDARSVLALLERKEDLARALLRAAREEGVGVSIGSENRCLATRECSIVSSPYWLGGARGAVGIIGPLRMEYTRAITLIDSVSRELTNYFSRQGGHPQSAN